MSYTTTCSQEDWNDCGHAGTFPMQLVREILNNFYVGGTVLDIFAGSGTVLRVCSERNIKGIGFEIYPKYTEFIKKNINEYCAVYTEDCRSLDKHLDEKSVDMVITSPPYWNTGKYGNDNQDLGNIDDYQTFLLNLQEIFAKVWNVSKFGASIFIVANDFAASNIKYYFCDNIKTILQNISYKFIKQIDTDHADSILIFRK